MENKNEFIWKLEEMILLNKNEHELINIVENTSKEAKINFINEMNGNKLNRILEADKKWHEDMKNDVIKKDYADRPKSVSYKAWIKRNGYLNIVSDFVNGGWRDTIGEIKLLGCDRRLGYLECIGKYDTFDGLIDELFYRQLKKCQKQENKYFLEHDEYNILKREVTSYVNQYGSLKMHISWGSDIHIYRDDKDEDGRVATLEDLIKIKSKYVELENFINNMDFSDIL